MKALELRDEIPRLTDDIYLNYGAHGPSPEPVVTAAQQSIEQQEYAYSGNENPYETAGAVFDSCREAIAAHLGVSPEWIGLTESTTAGINAIAGSIDWEPGDIVVRTDLEHAAGILPWKRLEAHGVSVRVVETENGRIDLDEFTEAVSGARLACFSALTWTHGTSLPVRELVDIAREQGALSLVDAVQVPGQQPVDLTEWNADIVAAAGHKWLLGLWGSGFLAIRPESIAELEPRSLGYRSVDDVSKTPLDYYPDARRFEIGTTNPAPFAALERALTLTEAIGINAIHSRIITLASHLIESVPAANRLSPATPESGLVAFEVPEPEETVTRLQERGITIRALPYPSAIRLSVHAVSTREEIDTVAAVLADEVG